MKKLLYTKIYRADLLEVPDYNGVSLALPATPEELQDALEQARTEDMGDVVARECYGMQEAAWLSPSIFPEEPSLRELNFFAGRMAELDNEDFGALHALVIRENPGPTTMQRLINLTYNTALFYLTPAQSDQELGEFYVDNLLSETLAELPDDVWQDMRKFMDLRRAGQLQREKEGGVFVCSGYAVPNPKAEFQEVYDGERLPEPPACLAATPHIFRAQLMKYPPDGTATAADGPDDPNAAWLAIPYGAQELKSALERLGAKTLEDCSISHIESPVIPDMQDWLVDVDAESLNTLGTCIQELRDQGHLRKYKAALYFTDCADLFHAIDLAKNLPCFDFYPEYIQPGDYARDILTRRYGLNDQSFYQHVNLDDYGCALMEKERITSTPYGFMGPSVQALDFVRARNQDQGISGPQL